MSNAIEVHRQGGGIVASEDEWSRARIELIKRTYCKGATDDELALFVATCQRTGLSPEARQIFAVKRRENVDGDWRDVMSTQTSIDGYRLIAQRSGEYAGQTPKQWCGEDGRWVDVWLKSTPPAAARAGVYRRGFSEPLVAIATYAEYVQTKKGGDPTAMWASKPALMLAKCAEALALRAAFPAELSGLYTAEEMGQSMQEIPAPQQQHVAHTRPPERAEVVETKELPASTDAAQSRNPHAQAIHILASNVAKAKELDADKLADLAVLHATGGESTSANALNRTTRDMAKALLEDIRDGKVFPAISIGEDGTESYVLAEAS